jgi:hypothetical protein
MMRRRRRTPLEIVGVNTAAVLLLADAALVAQAAYHSPAMAAWLAAVLLGYAAAATVLIAGCWTASYVWHATFPSRPWPGRSRQPTAQPPPPADAAAVRDDVPAATGGMHRAPTDLDDTQLLSAAAPRPYVPATKAGRL